MDLLDHDELLLVALVASAGELYHSLQQLPPTWIALGSMFACMDENVRAGTNLHKSTAEG